MVKLIWLWHVDPPREVSVPNMVDSPLPLPSPFGGMGELLLIRENGKKVPPVADGSDITLCP